MTYEEAIAWLKFRKDYDGELNHEYDDSVTALAIEALEKQIPKKPNAKRNEAICPNCGQTLTELFGFTITIPYCDRCGQAIDWRDDE